MQPKLLLLFVIAASAGKRCKNPVKCLKSPCSISKLPCLHLYPKATCTDDFCGGCNAIWRDRRGKVINCDPCAYPTECRYYQICIFNPCEFARKPKCQRKEAKCIPNMCEGCHAVFVNTRTGKKLPQKCDCVDCYGKWNVKYGKKKCKGCTCNDISKFGKKFIEKACKRPAIKETCCRLCRNY